MIFNFRRRRQMHRSTPSRTATKSSPTKSPSNDQKSPSSFTLFLSSLLSVAFPSPIPSTSDAGGAFYPSCQLPFAYAIHRILRKHLPRSLIRAAATAWFVLTAGLLAIICTLAGFVFQLIWYPFVFVLPDETFKFWLECGTSTIFSILQRTNLLLNSVTWPIFVYRNDTGTLEQIGEKNGNFLTNGRRSSDNQCSTNCCSCSDSASSSLSCTPTQSCCGGASQPCSNSSSGTTTTSCTPSTFGSRSSTHNCSDAQFEQSLSDNFASSRDSSVVTECSDGISERRNGLRLTRRGVAALESGKDDGGCQSDRRSLICSEKNEKPQDDNEDCSSSCRRLAGPSNAVVGQRRFRRRTLMMSNHLSNADGFIIPGLTEGWPVKVMYKSSLQKAPFFGSCMVATRHVPIYFTSEKGMLLFFFVVQKIKKGRVFYGVDRSCLDVKVLVVMDCIIRVIVVVIELF